MLSARPCVRTCVRSDINKLKIVFQRKVFRIHTCINDYFILGHGPLGGIPWIPSKTYGTILTESLKKGDNLPMVHLWELETEHVRILQVIPPRFVFNYINSMQQRCLHVIHDPNADTNATKSKPKLHVVIFFATFIILGRLWKMNLFLRLFFKVAVTCYIHPCNQPVIYTVRYSDIILFMCYFSCFWWTWIPSSMQSASGLHCSIFWHSVLIHWETTRVENLPNVNFQRRSYFRVLAGQ